FHAYRLGERDARERRTLRLRSPARTPVDIAAGADLSSGGGVRRARAGGAAERRCIGGVRNAGSAGAEAAALCGAREVGHLAFHGRRPKPPGALRSEAGAAAPGGAAAAGLFRAAAD